MTNQIRALQKENEELKERLRANTAHTKLEITKRDKALKSIIQELVDSKSMNYGDALQVDNPDVKKAFMRDYETLSQCLDFVKEVIRKNNIALH